MFKNRKLSRARGVTLIMVAGVLAVLAAMGAGFYTLTISQSRSAVRYADMVSAEFMARAGVEDAIGRLREQALLKSEDPTDPWFGVDYQHGASRKISFAAIKKAGALNSETSYSYSRSLANRVDAQSDRYTLNVTDAASKINVNACDNLGVVLDNLSRLIGPPLVSADLDQLQPARWAKEGAAGYASNKSDTAAQGACYSMPTRADKLTIDPAQQPLRRADGSALYGDGYAIARYRATHGPFKDLSDVLPALTVKADPNHPELELLERNVKFAALRDYITIDSWVDTTTVCTGKFEWISSDSQDAIAIDRDKSWIEDDPGDTLNVRGSLRGCYLAIVNGHGAGQLRRIKTNGVDWVKVDKGFTVDPGPISSYMIVAKEDALTDKVNIPNGLGPIEFPRENADGTLVDDPNIDYAVRPLCIHRAPVNINTASDKVLAALFMGINVQHGHPMAVGTDADLKLVSDAWRMADPQLQEPYLLTSLGIKRVPACMGKLVLDRPIPWSGKNASNYAYINNFGALNADSFVNMGGACNEAHELAYRVIRLREHALDAKGNPLKNDFDVELDAGQPQPHGPFTSWDDFYFRVIRPWDSHRVDAKYTPTSANKLPLGPLLMANFNPNTDILKFNPNIEWIDRWGRNFTEMEPVMQYTDAPGAANPPVADTLSASSKPIYAASEIRNFHGLNYELKDFNTGRAGTYVIRSYRFRSTDLIDKTDLNRSTCEFSFDSGGIFEIASTGQVVKNGVVNAERRIEAVVKVYDVWRETTQAQFVRGSIMKAKGAPGSNTSGTITRAQLAPGTANVNDRLALVTQPEPLVPKLYTIDNKNGLANTEVVDPQGTMYDAWGVAKKNNSIPDIISNHVLPANYDGQITLATNTAGFDPNGNDKDTFLASFNGDLDTDTCTGNGREQAKMPHIETGQNANKGYKFRVVDTCGLLGVLNDDLVDMEPEQNLRKKMYMFRTVDNALSGLKASNYWNNVTLRQGDLRTEGVYLSSPGVSGNESTLKYLVGEKYENFNPGSKDGLLITMWFKSTWKHSDGRNHEFFNASNPGKFWNTRACYLQKEGRWAFSAGSDGGGGISAHGKRANDLMFAFEGMGIGHNPYGFHGAKDNGDGDDADMVSMLHGGRNKVHEQGLQLSWEEGAGFGIDPSVAGESPMYRVQPFRWNMTGVRLQYEKGTAPQASWTQGRPFRGGSVSSRDQLLTTWSRPFMLSQMYPEGPATFKLDSYWAFDCVIGSAKFEPGSCEIGRATQQLGGGSRAINFQYPSGAGGTNGQDVKWNWADPKTAIDDPRYTQKVFVINNLNYGNSDKDMNVNDNDTSDTAQVNMWNYRHMPDGGTYAVIDELKISKRETVLGTGSWAKDRVFREMNTSRYYLPVDPKSRDECPTFESQTLLESIKGAQLQAAKTSQQVTLARVTWTVFTPRFMHEYLLPDGKFKQDEILLGQRKSVPFKGPFWYETYNNLKNGSQQRYDLAAFDNSGSPYFPYRVNRIPLSAYPKGTQPHSTAGVEVELLNDKKQIAVGFEGIDGVFKSVGGTFVNPDAINTFRDPRNPNAIQQVEPGKLRYRVRFRYPIDSTFVDPGETVVDPGRMLLLDTPVFDDISITYFAKPRVLSYKLVNE